MADTQLEYDVAEYLVNNKEILKSVCFPKPEFIEAGKSSNLKDYLDEFIEDYVILHLAMELSEGMNLNPEELSVILTKENVIKLLGKDMFYVSAN